MNAKITLPKTRTITKKQWDKFIPVGKLAHHLDQVAASMRKLPSDMRGKIRLTIEIGKPTK